jgi:SH3-like domain-containing protein
MARPGLLEFVVYALVLAIAAGWVYALPPFTHEPGKPRSQIQAAATSGSSEPAGQVPAKDPEATASVTPPAKLMVVTAKSLNMRSRPDARSALVGSYPRGALVEPVETSGNWVRVRTVADDSTGWMYAAYLGAADAD